MKVIGLGEVLWRLTPPDSLLLSQATSLQSQFGGAEFNVLGTLSHLGHETALVTALPANSIGQACQQFIRQQGVGCQYLVQQGERLGFYLYERGFGLRPSRITYDRAQSAFALSHFEDYDWEVIFKGADWLHVSGITVALSDNVYELSLRALQLAKDKGLGISVDLNYRESLWGSFEEARQRLAPIVALADTCFGLEPVTLPDGQGADLKDSLGLSRPYEDRQVLLDVLAAMAEQYRLDSIAFTGRQLSALGYQLKGYLYREGQLYETLTHETPALDRVGTGDAFAAGLLYGRFEGLSNQEQLDTAMASFVYKHSVEGDINLITPAHLAALRLSGASEITR